MHQKKSEVQIGKDSVGVSADFNPLLHLRQLPPRVHERTPLGDPSAAAVATAGHGGNFLQIQIQSSNSNYNASHEQGDPNALRQPHQQLLSTPHKRPAMNSTLSHSQTLQSLDTLNSDPKSPMLATLPAVGHHRRYRHLRFLPYAAASTTKDTLCHLLRRLHLRLLLLSFPSLYLLLGSGGGGNSGGRSLLLDFLSAISFSSALLLILFFSFSLFPLPSLRLLLSRSSSFLLPRYHPRYTRRRSPPPVLWSIGSDPKTKADKLPTSGSWVQVYSNGDVYEGEFHRGKCSGSGVYYYYMSGRYEGDWVDEKYDGCGVETWARGSRYRGQYRQGLRHGFGIYRFYTGDLYAGEWSSGQSHGCGVHTCEDGSRYVGEFKWGVKHGLGHYHFRNGDTYSGEYFADKMHGFGVYRFANGHRYEGAWHEGRRQGLGMYTFRNGETQSGLWENGVLAIRSTQNSLSALPIAVNHSKVLNVVQEARRASERAFNVPRVDERVNKAVAAANKAANAARVAAVKAVQKQMHSSRSDIPMPIV
ncbi:unnamed protein product [Spirodela intermedia]|uniref:Uncharacterized protein n=1 Tax=Spirodela intermedia TaxID=51605 RepID=A0A7I8LMH3_SPIIN|nr:unnamed protein product [Spirodela intermedia]